MAKKTDPPAPVGAGDLGAVVQCLREAATALRGGDWRTALLHIWHVVEEAKKALESGPHPVMMAASGECEKQACDLELCASRMEAAGAVDWASILSMLLPLLLKLFQK